MTTNETKSTEIQIVKVTVDSVIIHAKDWENLVADIKLRHETNVKLEQQRDEFMKCILYYKNEFSGAEPSLSVLNRMIDESLAKVTT